MCFWRPMRKEKNGNKQIVYCACVSAFNIHNLQYFYDGKIKTSIDTSLWLSFLSFGPDCSFSFANIVDLWWAEGIKFGILSGPWKSNLIVANRRILLRIDTFRFLCSVRIRYVHTDTENRMRNATELDS